MEIGHILATSPHNRERCLESNQGLECNPTARARSEAWHTNLLFDCSRGMFHDNLQVPWSNANDV